MIEDINPEDLDLTDLQEQLDEIVEKHKHEIDKGQRKALKKKYHKLAVIYNKKAKRDVYKLTL